MLEIIFILMILLPALLYLISGPAHTTGQFLIRTIAFGIGLIGLIILEIRKRKRFSVSFGNKFIILMKEHIASLNTKISKEECLRYFGLFAIYLISLIIIFIRPLEVFHWQSVDDALYFNNAQSIISNMSGKSWLGPFNIVVISKAPFFSVFLASIYYLGIPLRLAEFFLFAPMPFLFWQAVRPLQIGKWPAIYIAALCLVCIPIAGLESRLLRTTLFGALSLYCMISLTGVITRSWSRKGSLWPWVVSAGLALGLATTTREEASWLMLPTGIAILLSLLMAWKSRKLVHLALIVPLIFVGYFLPVTFFSTLNYLSYGVFSPSLRQNSAFRELYAILCSLQPDQRQRYVPINTKARELAYAISPHFAELRQYLDSPAMDPIARSKPHLALNGWDAGGREFFVSNFEFALTSAIFQAGYKTGPAFLDFCRQATKEIHSAIESHKIEHGRKGFSMLPPALLSDADDIFLAGLRSFWFLVTGQGQYRAPYIEKGPASNIADKWHSFLRTGPYPPLSSEPSSIKFKNLIFNMIVTLFRLSYAFFLILGFVAGGKAYKNKSDNYPLILYMLLVSWSALVGFCFSMGLVDTIAWPALLSPGCWNSMGFFPLHFLILISGLVFWWTLKSGIFRKPSMHSSFTQQIVEKI